MLDEQGEELLWPAPRTFFGAPSCHDLSELRAQVAFMGVPYDIGTLQPSIRTGQSAAPGVARLNSWNTLEYTWPPGGPPGEGAFGWFDVEDGREYLGGVSMADVGDVAIVGAEVQLNLGRITEATRRVAERDALVVAVGGDHSISFPVGRGLERFGPFDVVHFDAHADFADEWFGVRYSHGSQLRRLSELPFVRSITAIGLRNIARFEYDDLLAYGANIVTSRQVLDESAADVVRRVVPESDRLYVSIDIDVLDLPIVAGTTLPEPGGISYRDLREGLAAVAEKGRVVGFDIVELSPPHDGNAATARVTVWLITHFLSAIFGPSG
ncbi:MAG TPA: arginase family protein [Actinomycetota bacterium]|nr:arginase family protein [Actinomycetota bacterium]